MGIVIASAVLSFLVAMLMNFGIRDAYAWLPRLQRWLLRRAAERMPPDLKAQYYEEALAEVEELPPAELSRTIRAIGFYIAAGSINRERRDGASLPDQIASRVLDISFSTVAIVLMWPAFLVISIFVKRGGNAFSRISTVGKSGCRFDRYKFRTHRASSPMAETPARNNFPSDNMVAFANGLSDEGRWLRASSIDELPLLLNVARGEMSLVGPRPCSSDEFDRLHVEDRQQYVNHRPGLISPSAFIDDGRSNFQVDFSYMRNRNVLKDMILICRAMALLFLRNGPY